VFGPSDRRDDRAWVGSAGARTPPLWSLVAQGGLDQAPFRTLALVVLPANDDEAAAYRSIGAGMNRRPPRSALLYLVVQTQGIVGIVAGSVAAAFGGLAAAPFAATVATLYLLLAALARHASGRDPAHPSHAPRRDGRTVLIVRRQDLEDFRAAAFGHPLVSGPAPDSPGPG